jgi:hypothetical protein
MGLRLVIGFINHLQVVTTNIYYITADLHDLHSLPRIFSVYFH